MSKELGDATEIGLETDSEPLVLKLFGLSVFVKQALWIAESPLEDLSDVLPLTTRGQQLYDLLGDENFSDAEKRLALLSLLFYGAEPLVDGARVDIGKLVHSVSDLIAHDFVKYPYIFDRILYSKLFEEFPPYSDKLTPDETLEFLKDTPQGVWQVSELVSGPLGLLLSKERRLFSPKFNLPLWHCNTVSCEELHPTKLSGDDRVEYAIAKLRTAYAEEIEDTDAARNSCYEALDRRYHDDYWASEMIAFLGDCFSETELKEVLNEMLQQALFRDDGLRAILKLGLKQKKANDLAALAKPAVLQLVLCQTDDEIIAILDHCIATKKIVVPTLEIRKIVAAPTKMTWQRNSCEVSSLGFRTNTSHSQTTPLARLRRLIFELYPAQEKTLAWKLRKITGQYLGEKVEGAIRGEDLRSVVEEFVFDSPETLGSALRHLHAEHLKIPQNEHEEARFVDILLWKLGFDQPSIESSAAKLAKRVAELKTAALLTLPQEQWRDQVRSVGVNTFVSVEEFLEETLCFTTWLLLGDHVGDRYRFNLLDARRITAHELSGIISTSEGPIELNADGRNTLFPLIHGFSALVEKINRLVAEGVGSGYRPKSALPRYSLASKLQLYPYLRTPFVLNLDERQVAFYTGIIGEVVALCGKGNILSARNGIDHKSDSFPSKDELINCCEALESVLDLCDRNGLAPTIFVLKRLETDSYFREIVTSVSFKGDEVKWYQSPSLHCCNHSRPSITAPQILVRGLFMPGTGEIFRCGVVERSEYTAMWDGFIQRKGLAEEDSEQTAGD